MSSLRRYYFIVPILYISIVLIFFANYNAQKNEIQLSWGQLTIIAQPKITEKNHITNKNNISSEIQINRVKIIFNAIVFSFNSSVSITPQKNSTLQSIQILPSNNGILLVFSENITIVFQTSLLNKEELAISIHIPDNTIVSIPIKKKLLTKIKPLQNTLFREHTSVNVSTLKQNYILRILGEGSIINNKELWSIKSSASHVFIRYGAIHSAGFVPIKKTPIIPATIASQSRRLLSQYIEKMYTTILNSRYDEVSGSWLQPEGVYEFSEDALMASYAEATLRKELPKYRLPLKKSLFVHLDSQTWKSAVIGIQDKNTLTQMYRQVRQFKEVVLLSIKTKNYNILTNLDLLEKAYIFFDKDTQNILLSFISSLSLTTLTPNIAVSLLTQEKHTQWSLAKENIKKIYDILTGTILDNIVVANNGYMLRSNKNEIDVKSSLLAGYYLSRYSKEKPIQYLGHRIIITVLNLSNTMGFLPRIYILKNKDVKSLINPLGFISPETIYKWIANNKYYPRFTTFRREGFKNINILSSTPISIKTQGNSVDITVDVLQKDSSQLMYIINAGSPKKIFAFNAFWSGLYFTNEVSQVVYYNKPYDSMIIKMSSSRQKETVSLQY